MEKVIIKFVVIKRFNIHFLPFPCRSGAKQQRKLDITTHPKFDEPLKEITVIQNFSTFDMERTWVYSETSHLNFGRTRTILIIDSSLLVSHHHVQIGPLVVNPPWHWAPNEAAETGSLDHVNLRALSCQESNRGWGFLTSTSSSQEKQQLYNTGSCSFGIENPPDLY